ncbi:hypothetical protein [Bacillus bombysepticus]|uniref:hypothetical protein n=1 Tax=Bacillus bombysepticus TaxID=658666 RepID=UPI00301A7B91
MKYWIGMCFTTVCFVLLAGFSILIPIEKSVENQHKGDLQEAIILDISGTGIAHATNFTVAIVQINGEIHNVNIEGLEVGNINSKQALVGRTILVQENPNDVFPYTAQKLK